MPRLNIDAGGEYLLPFAKRKLDVLKGELARAGRTVGSKFVLVDTGETVFVNTLKVGSFWQDSIRITVQKGRWDFYIVDSEFAGAQGIDMHFGQVGKAKLTKHAEGNSSVASTPFSSSASSQLIFPDITLGWRWIDKNQKLSAFAPATFGGTAVATSEDSKVVALLTNGGDQRLTDGAIVVPVTPTTGAPTLYVRATKRDGFYVSQGLDTGVFKAKIISLARSIETDTNGNVIDPTGTLQDETLPATVIFMAVPLVNYTDILTSGLDHSGLSGTLLLYRNGVLEHTAATVVVSQSPLAYVCSKDSVTFFLDMENNYGNTSGGTFDEHLLIIDGMRQDDGTYLYIEQVVSLDTNWYGFPIASPALTVNSGFSDSARQFFVIHVREVAAVLEIVTQSIDSSGNRTEAIGFPFAYSEAVAYGSALGTTGYFTVAFYDKSCFIGPSPSAGVSWRRTIFFYFSDGTHALGALPAGAAHVVPASVGGSKDTAYVHVTDGGVEYLVDSTGSVRVLALPTRDIGASSETAILAFVGSFIDQKEGCALMFEAIWGTSPQSSYHHWDENGAIFTYGPPSLTYDVLPLLSVPTPTAQRRMELIEAWGA